MTVTVTVPTPVTVTVTAPVPAPVTVPAMVTMTVTVTAPVTVMVTVPTPVTAAVTVMSENSGPICLLCDGKGFFTAKKLWKSDPSYPDDYEIECNKCLGTGKDGSTIAYEQKAADLDWEKDRPDDTRWEWK